MGGRNGWGEGWIWAEEAGGGENEERIITLLIRMEPTIANFDNDPSPPSAFHRLITTSANPF